MPTISRSVPVEVPAASFDAEAADVVNEVRAALAALVASLPGQGTRGIDLERQLQIDKKLAWRISRLIGSVGLGEAANVPGRPAMQRLLASAAAAGIPDHIISRIADASERFERFAATHGGNREEVISLMVRLAGEADDPYELKMRKAYFRTAAHAWGVQARLQVRTMIHQWATPNGGYRGVLVAGDIGLQRRDPTRPLVVSARLQAETDAGSGSPGARDGGPELLTSYCSDPLPQMAPQSRGEGHIETEMIFPISGRNGAITLYTSRSVKGSDHRRDGVSAQMFATMPVEEVVCDLVLEAGWTDPASARVAIYGCRHRPEHISELSPSDLFPQRETVTYLGAVESIPPIAGAPSHQDAVRDVLQRCSWGTKRFDIYRCRVQYPILHTMIILRVDPRPERA